MKLTPATPEQAARLQQVYDRIHEIEKQRHVLKQETQALEREIATIYGYGEGEHIVAHRNGDRYAIRGPMHGNFEFVGESGEHSHPFIRFGYGRKIRKDGTPAARSTYCGVDAVDGTVKIKP